MPPYPPLGLEGWHLWMIAGVLLGVAELLAPGAYLMFLGAAAFVTGMLVLGTGAQGPVEFAIFGLLAIVFVWLGWMLYKRAPQESSDPMLNDRAARLVGKTVRVVEPVTATGGRARVGDGEWPARGPELPAGAVARIVSVENGVVYLDRVEEDASHGASPS